MSLHPIKEAELLDEWSDFVEGLIRQHLSTPYLGESVVVTNEYHDGDGTNLLFVSKAPIISVQSLSVNGVVLLSSEYRAFPTYIELDGMVFPEGSLNVIVSYTSGSSGMDDTVRLAASAMIVAIINYRKRFGADSSVRWAALDQKVGEESPNMGVGLVDHLNAIMKNVLRRPKLRLR
jgi:hypothetical protein